MKLSDLELCKRIAEIEGVECHEYAGYLIPRENFNEAVNEIWNDSMVQRIGVELRVDKLSYNPLTNKDLLFDLMIKYEVEVHYDYFNCAIYNGWNGLLPGIITVH